ncbi:porin [Geothrix paludis]|uniref:porin n=1 Tax=Geothrix paludis TaxID=2922722 RepID=UPI001FAC456C|nr:porin [Geothrix paludis]
MKKISHVFTLVTTSIVCGSAFAQTGPTIYGVADLTVESTKAEGSTTAPGTNDIPSRTRLNANSSLLGVKGKVSLVGNNALIYQFETYIDLGNNQVSSMNTPVINNDTTVPVSGLGGSGTSVFGARRDTFLGVTGDWGTLKAGYLTSGFRGATAKVDLVPGATGIDSSYTVFGFAGPGKSYFQRMPSIMYTTPTFNGFSAAVNYIVDTAKANAAGNVDPGGWDVLARYETELFHISYVHTDLKDVLWGGYRKETNKSDALFAGINFPTGTTLSAMYNTSKSTLTTTAAVPVDVEVKQNSFYVGVKQAIGKHEFLVNFQKAPDFTGTNLASAAGGALATTDTGATQFGARYAYNILKSTQIYGVYSRITNSANAAYNFNIGSIGASTGQTVQKGADPTSFGFGMRFTF